MSTHETIVVTITKKDANIYDPTQKVRLSYKKSAELAKQPQPYVVCLRTQTLSTFLNARNPVVKEVSNLELSAVISQGLLDTQQEFERFLNSEDITKMPKFADVLETYNSIKEGRAAKLAAFAAERAAKEKELELEKVKAIEESIEARIAAGVEQKLSELKAVTKAKKDIDTEAKLEEAALLKDIPAPKVAKKTTLSDLKKSS